MADPSRYSRSCDEGVRATPILIRACPPPVAKGAWQEACQGTLPVAGAGRVAPSVERRGWRRTRQLSCAKVLLHTTKPTSPRRYLQFRGRPRTARPDVAVPARSGRGANDRAAQDLVPSGGLSEPSPPSLSSSGSPTSG